MYSNDNIKLIPFTEDNITPEYLSWFNDPEVCKFNSHCRFPMTRKRALEFMETINHPSNSTIVWGIHCKNNKKNPDTTHVGNISLDSINFINRTAELSIIVGEKKYWGKGIATDAMKLIFEHAFLRLNLEKVWLGTAEENVGMQKCALKAGMRKEGVIQKTLYVNGKYTDDLIFGISRYRFNRLRNEGEGDNESDK